MTVHDRTRLMRRAFSPFMPTSIFSGCIAFAPRLVMLKLPKHLNSPVCANLSFYPVKGKSMRHRIRAAGLLIDQDRILMVNENDGEWSYWVPPGGGFEDKDGNTRNTVKREVWEETGLSVTVGELLFVREFCETSRGIYHFEQFYMVDHWQGEVSLKNLEGLDEEVRSISQARWLTQRELADVEVFPPQLKDMLWGKLDRHDLSIVHLGYS